MKTFFRVLIMSLLFISCSSSDDTDNSGQNLNSETNMNSNDGSNDNNDNSNITYQGTFVSVAHPTTGLVQVDSEARSLTFTDFMTDAGPVLEVYLATDDNAANYISLGELQGTIGNQTYVLPNNIDFETHKYVIIWCVDFSVNFGYAILDMS